MVASMSDVPDLEKPPAKARDSGRGQRWQCGCQAGAGRAGLGVEGSTKGGREDARDVSLAGLKREPKYASGGGGQESNLGVKLDHVAVVGRHAWKKKKTFRVSHYRRHLQITGEHLILISSLISAPTSAFFPLFDPPLDNAPLGSG